MYQEQEVSSGKNVLTVFLAISHISRGVHARLS
jgi:hypothetical protein